MYLYQYCVRYSRVSHISVYVFVSILQQKMYLYRYHVRYPRVSHRVRNKTKFKLIKVIFINIDGIPSKTIPISHHGHIQGEDTYNADLPIIPLIWIRQSTNNFSELCKLGAGGFGPVYKVCFLILNTEMLIF